MACGVGDGSINEFNVWDACGVRDACGVGDGSINEWDGSKNGWEAVLCSWKAEDEVTWVQFSPVNNSIVATVSSETITVWDVDSGETLKTFMGCEFAAFSPDGHTIATSAAETDLLARDLLLVDAETGTVRSTLVAAHYASIAAACFFDESKLASVSNDGCCKVWDSSTGALLRIIDVGYPLIAVSWGRDWVRDTQTSVAFAMGHHPRLGERSQVLALDAGVVRMILDRV
jgi:WD40 repeat protein